MTRKRFIKLCMGRLHLSRNQAAALAESKGLAYHMSRMAISMQECAQVLCSNVLIDSACGLRHGISLRHVKRVRDGVIEYDE